MSEVTLEGSHQQANSREIIPLAKEYFRLSSGDRFIEIANYDEPLNQSEAEQIAAAFRAVSDFTEGKIFDRVSAIDLLPSGHMESGEQAGSDELEGDYDLDTQKVRLNIGFARHLALTSDPGFASFREKFFPDSLVTPLQFELAHEALHAMDLQYVEEIDAHGINKDASIPQHSHRGKVGGFSAFMHPDVQGSATESAPTPRAEVSKREDFAESGAIAALGGDVSLIPNRIKRVREAIKLAKGKKIDTPSDVILTKVA